MQDVLIDVVIPYKNNYRRLLDLIEELRKVKFLGKIIVVRDYCVDPIPLVASHYPVVFVENDDIPGALSARYVGVRSSLADYIMFFDSDDFYVGGKLSELKIDADVIISDYVVNGVTKNTKRYMSQRSFSHNLTLVPFSGLIVKREALLNIESSLNLGIRSCQDDLLLAALFFGGHTFKHSNMTLSNLCTSADSISVNENRMKDMRFILKVFRKEIVECSLFGWLTIYLWRFRLSLLGKSRYLSRLFTLVFFRKASF